MASRGTPFYQDSIKCPGNTGKDCSNNTLNIKEERCPQCGCAVKKKWFLMPESAQKCSRESNNDEPDYSSNLAQSSIDSGHWNDELHTNKPTTARTLTIQFHVLCPKDKHDGEDVYLISCTTMKKKTMQKQCDYDKFSEYQCSITLPLSGIEYFKYTVERNNDKSVVMPLVRRPEKEVIKQYHAFIKDNWANYLFPQKDYLKSAAEFFFNKILSKIIKLPLSEVWSIKEIVDDIDHIFKCLDQQDMYTYKLSMFIEAVVLTLEKDLENNKKFFLAYLAVEFCVRLQVTVKKDCHILCQNLLLPTEEPDTWEVVVKKLFQNNFHNGEKIKEFCKICAENGDPSWLYCIPLIHFQYNDIQPFQKPHVCFKFEGWWGTKHIQDIIDIFIKSLVKEDM